MQNVDVVVDHTDLLDTIYRKEGLDLKFICSQNHDGYKQLSELIRMGMGMSVGRALSNDDDDICISVTFTGDNNPFKDRERELHFNCSLANLSEKIKKVKL